MYCPGDEYLVIITQWTCNGHETSQAKAIEAGKVLANRGRGCRECWLNAEGPSRRAVGFEADATRPRSGPRAASSIDIDPEQMLLATGRATHILAPTIISL